MESTEAGDQACMTRPNSISTGDQATVNEDILDYEPEEEEDQNLTSISQILEKKWRSGQKNLEN